MDNEIEFEAHLVNINTYKEGQFPELLCLRCLSCNKFKYQDTMVFRLVLQIPARQKEQVGLGFPRFPPFWASRSQANEIPGDWAKGSDQSPIPRPKYVFRIKAPLFSGWASGWLKVVVGSRTKVTRISAVPLK